MSNRPVMTELERFRESGEVVNTGRFPDRRFPPKASHYNSARVSGNILRLDVECLKTPALRFLETGILRERC